MEPGDNVDQSIAARDVAQRLLTRREHSRRELLAKLKIRGFDSSLAYSVIDDLEDEGLQSDLRFAEAFAYSRRGRLQGPMKIRAELQNRGVNKTLINEALEPYSGEWPELAAAFIRKRNMEAWLTDYDLRQKVYRRLANRGFSHADAIAAIEEIKSA